MLGGFLGWLIIDPLTGAMWKLRPVNVQERLDKTYGSASPGSLYVILANQVAPELMREAEPITPES